MPFRMATPEATKARFGKGWILPGRKPRRPSIETSEVAPQAPVEAPTSMAYVDPIVQHLIQQGLPL